MEEEEEEEEAQRRSAMRETPRRPAKETSMTNLDVDDECLLLCLVVLIAKPEFDLLLLHICRIRVERSDE